MVTVLGLQTRGMCYANRLSPVQSVEAIDLVLAYVGLVCVTQVLYKTLWGILKCLCFVYTDISQHVHVCIYVID